MLKIIAVSPQHPDALLLLQAAAVEVRQLYADLIPPLTPSPTNEPATPRSAYFVAYYQNQPVGSIAVRPLEPGAGEVRRMYILPEFRRLGLATALLEVIEQKALELGYTILRLETGSRQLPAIALYQKCGFLQIPAFGVYQNDPTSICFEKTLR